MSRLTKSQLLKIFRILLKHFGKRSWWPADSPFEVVVGAILTQNTNWTNVEKAITNLKREKLLNPKALLKAPSSKIARAIRSSGYFNQKTKKLKNFVKYLDQKYNLKLSSLRKQETEKLRNELLGLHGIGPETADSILCYALDKLSFVVDAYTRRIFKRLGLIKTDDYHQIKDFFEKNLPKDLYTYQEFHALIVELGKNYCKKKPVCTECPLGERCEKEGIRGLKKASEGLRRRRVGLLT